MAKIIEMSYPIGEQETPVLDHFPKVAFNPIHRIKAGNLANSTQFCLPTHSGTHVDAPRHFIDTGLTIDQIPIDRFYFVRPYLLNLVKEDFEEIHPEEIDKIGNELQEIDLLMIYTGFSKYRNSDSRRYNLDGPGLSVSSANLLVSKCTKLKAIAVDLLSIENLTNGRKRQFPVHKALLNDDFQNGPFVLLEDVNLNVLRGKTPIEVIAAPIRLLGLDGAPVTIIARMNN